MRANLWDWQISIHPVRWSWLRWLLTIITMSSIHGSTDTRLIGSGQCYCSTTAVSDWGSCSTSHHCLFTSWLCSHHLQVWLQYPFVYCLFGWWGFSSFWLLLRGMSYHSQAWETIHQTFLSSLILEVTNFWVAAKIIFNTSILLHILTQYTGHIQTCVT